MDSCGTPQVTFLYSELVSLIQTVLAYIPKITTYPLISNTSDTIVSKFFMRIFMYNSIKSNFYVNEYTNGGFTIINISGDIFNKL